ncbi:MAG: hypothetical protein HY526_09370 [Betaproteobacteria bacterium]|nr:hypothetical protein [Betaproteobacteria bacterium]
MIRFPAARRLRDLKAAPEDVEIEAIESQVTRALQAGELAALPGQSETQR